MFDFQKRLYGTPGSPLVVIFTGWGNRQFLWYPVAKNLERFGFSSLVYTYHSTILSPDTTATLERFAVILRDAQEQLKQLERSGYHPACALGNSLGTVLAVLLAAESPSIQRVILNLATADVTETVWTWDRFCPSLKAGLIAQGLDQNDVRRRWKALSPMSHVHQLHGKRLLFFVARHDQVIPYDHAIRLYESVKRANDDVRLVERPWGGHVANAVWNMAYFPTYLRFLRE